MQCVSPRAAGLETPPPGGSRLKRATGAQKSFYPPPIENQTDISWLQFVLVPQPYRGHYIEADLFCGFGADRHNIRIWKECYTFRTPTRHYSEATLK